MELDEKSGIEKSWTKCVNDLVEVYVPMRDVAPEKDKWTLIDQVVYYESLAPTNRILQEWIKSERCPRIEGSFFIRDNVEHGEGVYECIPSNMLVGTILVRRYVANVFYRIGEDRDPVHDPGNEYKYHINYIQCKPRLDKNFIWNPKRRALDDE